MLARWFAFHELWLESVGRRPLRSAHSSDVTRVTSGAHLLPPPTPAPPAGEYPGTWPLQQNDLIKILK